MGVEQSIVKRGIWSIHVFADILKSCVSDKYLPYLASYFITQEVEGTRAIY